MKVGDKEFTRTKFSSMEGHTVVAFDVEGDDLFLLSARPRGLELEGKFELTTEQELQDFAKLISEAWSEHRKLKPKLVQTLSGH